MAIYRSIQMSFWTDSKVVDDFTPEDRYFYLYLFTNPHTNLCGCYEISKTQMALELGYSKETVERLIKRFETIHGVIRYCEVTKEIILLNWHKYNWTQSEKFRVALTKEINSVKNADFKAYLSDLEQGIDTVSIPYPYPMDTTVTDTVTNTVIVKDNKKQKAEHIIELYHNHCPSFPRVMKVTDKRIKAVNARLKDYTEEELIAIFDKAEKSSFLRCGNDRWKGADFDFVTNPEKIVKISEGFYDDKKASTPYQKHDYDFEALNQFVKEN